MSDALASNALSSRPILFTGEMVRAILEGRKTQTRRVVKITHRTPGLAACLEPADPAWIRPHVAVELCPYGKADAQLWVRETWARRGQMQAAIYKADEQRALGAYGAVRWRRSIHMPRWASRLSLRITNIRVERLQEISYEDAVYEGCGLPEMRFEPVGEGETWEQTARRLRWPQRTYEQLWNHINGAGSWNVNPWVWVVEFERIEQARAAA